MLESLNVTYFGLFVFCFVLLSYIFFLIKPDGALKKSTAILLEFKILWLIQSHLITKYDGSFNVTESQNLNVVLQDFWKDCISC